MNESTTSTTSSLISYPTRSPTPPAPQIVSPPANQVLKDRLYIGNLHPTVDEYTLLQLFSKHGKVSKLDFLFHKTGPAKGKPRGYAFVEYASKEDAVKALGALHDKLLRGRRLTVTFAHQAPQVDTSHPTRRFGTDTSRPTTLSLLKTQNRLEATKDKIAALEAKLRQMEHKPESTAPLTLLPSSLPPKPLVSALPNVPAGGVQRKPRTSDGSSLYPDSVSLPSKSSLPLSRPSLASTASAGTAPLTSSRATSAQIKGLPAKPGTSHKHTTSSLGISIKR